MFFGEDKAAEVSSGSSETPKQVLEGGKGEEKAFH